MDQLIEFAGNHTLLVLAALMLGVLLVVYEVRLRTRGFDELTPAETVLLMNANALVLDVRSKEQFAAGHIVGARNVPLERIGAEAQAKLLRQPDKPIVTCCANGVEGARAAKELKEAGLNRVFNMKGGLDAWQRDEYPLQKQGKK